MKVLQNLAELENWCLGPEAKPGAQELFSIGEEVTQEKASEFAFQVNQKRDGHVWIYVLGLAFVPMATTKVRVRCTT